MDTEVKGMMLGVGSQALGNIMSLAHNENKMGMQTQSQKELMDYQNQKQFEMWQRTNYAAQRKEMERAGLNVALMYKNGGAGGQLGGGMPSAPSGDTSEKGMVLLEGLRQAKELELLEAEKENIQADTAFKVANTETENDKRDILIENMKQSGISTWFENLKTKWQREGNTNEVDMYRNAIYGTSAAGYNEDSPDVKKFNQELFKTAAEERNLDANALLSNEKAMAIWKELLIAQQQADANTINAKANELSKMWETGEFTNWKTWTDLAKDATQALGGLIKSIKTTPTPKSKPNNWMYNRQ